MRNSLIKVVYLIITLSLAVSCDRLLFIDNEDFLVVTKYIKPNTGEDVSKQIQRLIDNNPNRTLYFPDGEYCIASPIRTSSDPHKSVSLKLSNYAIIKAINNWPIGSAMVALGAKDYTNDIFTPGSNYFLEGGIIDGSGIAKGISIDSGRETSIRNVSIKDVSVGIHILKGINNGSSDCDIENVNIVGNDDVESIGIIIEGNDNTFSNMRIARVHIGVKVSSSGNHLCKIHPLYYGNGIKDYDTSCGGIDEGGDNWYEFCYSDEFSVGFVSHGHNSIYDNCYAFWYSNRGNKHVAFKADGVFNSYLTNFKVGFTSYNFVENNIVLEEVIKGGRGVISGLHITNEQYLTDKTHLKYMK